MANARSPETLAARDALDDLGWFWGLFTSLVNAPSILSLVQMVFIEHRLVDALQWIVDGYNDITRQILAWCEPILRPVLDWINGAFGWDLEIHPHWIPFFLLTLTIVVGWLRHLWVIATGKGQRTIAAAIAGGAIGAFFGALASGLLPLDAPWWGQGVAAAAPAALMMLSIAIVTNIPGTRAFADTMLGCVVLTSIAFGLGVGVSFIPGVTRGAGLIAIGLSIIAVGGLIVLDALRGQSDRMLKLRQALTILGGFLAAAGIVGADAAIRWLTA